MQLILPLARLLNISLSLREILKKHIINTAMNWDLQQMKEERLVLNENTGNYIEVMLLLL